MPSTFQKLKIIENGPVRVVLRLYRGYLKLDAQKEFPTEDFPPNFFIRDIIPYNEFDRKDFKTDVEWFGEKTMLKVAFPLTVDDLVATYKIS